MKRLRYAEPLELRSLTLDNRLFMAPMCQYSAADGVPNDWHDRHYRERALGGAALVVVEATAVSPEGRISPADLGLWNEVQAEAFARLVDGIHRAGAKAAVQLAHAGRKASSAVPWLGSGAVAEADGGWTPLAPTAIPFDGDYAVPRAMGRDDIERLVEAFAAAARRAIGAGFDAVELHAAHGYLIHQFLSPLSNHREDGYGGDPAGRSRFPAEVARAVRAALPPGSPLMVRVSATDWVDGGWDLEACSAFLKGLSGVADFVDVSSGGLVPGAKMPVGPGYQVGLAAAIKAATALPVGAVGLITTPEQVEQILVSGAADAVSLGRLLLRDPYWPARNLPEERRRIPPQYLRAF